MSYYSALNTYPLNALTDYGGTCQDNLYFTLQRDQEGWKNKVCRYLPLTLHSKKSVKLSDKKN